jgi:hypothetical protein
LLDDAALLDKRTNDILRALRGDSALRARNVNLPPSISERVGDIVGQQRLSTSRPTQTQINQYTAAAQEFEQTLAQLRQLIEGDLRDWRNRWKQRAPPGRQVEFRNGKTSSIWSAVTRHRFGLSRPVATVFGFESC